MTYLAALGREIRDARKAAGLTQRALAAQLSVTIQTVWNYEHGVYDPGVDTLHRIEEITGQTNLMGRARGTLSGSKADPGLLGFLTLTPRPLKIA